MIEGVGKYTGITNRYFKMYMNKQLESYELQAFQMPILIMIQKENTCTQEYINNSLHIDKGVLCRLTKDLLGKGYITKTKHPTDKRAFLLHLTPKGESIIPELKACVNAWHEYIFEGFCEEEILLFTNMLEKVTKKSYQLIIKEKEGI